MGEKKATTTKRNVKSWKAEAQKLERLLVEANEHLDSVCFNEGAELREGALLAWWEARNSEAKRVALSKLTKADRVALGVGEAAPKAEG